MVGHQEEAPVLARLAEVPDRLRPFAGVAVVEDGENDDGDAVLTARSARLARGARRRGHDCAVEA